ncbi:MAG: hypothetical protein JKX73_05595 [Flavobacteriales bacterium]|nr:hypothetical protein [Flavobacteriales bacterium]
MRARVLILVFGILVFNPETGKSQESVPEFNPTAKGKMFIHWGYNRSSYTNSDIAFSGPDYDFELLGVVAKDRQSPFNFKTYFGITSFTIPQYNFIIGYYFRDGFSISFNADHMKYVVESGQTTTITGTIEKNSSEFNGSYNQAAIDLTPEFLYFEHTDGLNYENIELTRYLDLWFNDKGNVDFNGQIGVAIGALVPRSNVLLMGEGTDEFHLAGFGTSATAGVMLTLFKNWVLQYKVKGGYMNMPDIVTNGSKNPERVKQSFWFLERFFTVGANIPIKGKKKLID